MKILPLRLFESVADPASEISNWLNVCTEGTWTADSMGKISVDGNFDCSFQDLQDFKGLEFSRVSGDFDCSGNDLENLKGSPRYIGGTFDCSENVLKSLINGPEEVVKNYVCSDNKLKDLEGVSVKIGGSLICSYNSLEDIKICPEKIPGSFVCSHNPKLKSLQGGPKVVFKNYKASFCSLESKDGFPSFVGGSFNLSHNKIKSLDGFPTQVTSDINLSLNEISSILGAVLPIEGDLDLSRNQIPQSQLYLLGSLSPFIKATRYELSDAIILRGIDPYGRIQKNIAAPSTDTLGFPNVQRAPLPTGQWEKLTKNQMKQNLETLYSLCETPKDFYSRIQENPDRLSIVSFIKNEMPEIWEKIQDQGKSKLSAEAGDLYF